MPAMKKGGKAVKIPARSKAMKAVAKSRHPAKKGAGAKKASGMVSTTLVVPEKVPEQEKPKRGRPRNAETEEEKTKKKVSEDLANVLLQTANQLQQKKLGEGNMFATSMGLASGKTLVTSMNGNNMNSMNGNNMNSMNGNNMTSEMTSTTLVATENGTENHSQKPGKTKHAILINPTAEKTKDGTLVTKYGLSGNRQRVYKAPIVSKQHEVLWKYKRSIKDPIKRLKLTAGEGAVQRQIVRVNPITCSETGVSFISRGDRIGQKVWSVAYRDAQFRKRNRWINCRDFVNIDDPIDQRESRARGRAMVAAVNFLRNHKAELTIKGLLKAPKVQYEGRRESGVVGVRWLHFPYDKKQEHRVGWVASISAVNFTGKLKSGRAARPVTRSFTLDKRDYEIIDAETKETSFDEEAFEEQLEKLRLAAVGQRKKWERQVFVYEESCYPTYESKAPEKLSLHAHLELDPVEEVLALENIELKNEEDDELEEGSTIISRIDSKASSSKPSGSNGATSSKSSGSSGATSSKMVIKTGGKK